MNKSDYYRISVISICVLAFLVSASTISSAVLSEDEVLQIAKSSLKEWKIGEMRQKDGRTEVSILFDKKEILKLKIPGQITEKQEVEGILSSITFGYPALKQKKEGNVYEIPVILNGRETGKLKIDPISGEIIGKKPKFKFKGGSTEGHFTGIAGTILVVISQFYSLRKRRLISSGTMRFWLYIHSYLSLVGTILVFIHAGFPYDFKFYELKKGGLGVLTTYLMVIVTSSGIYGRFLYRRSRYFERWRDIHTMIVVVLFTLIAAHVTLTIGGD